jgi:hypothetical protein
MFEDGEYAKKKLTSQPNHRIWQANWRISIFKVFSKNPEKLLNVHQINSNFLLITRNTKFIKRLSPTNVTFNVTFNVT